MAKKIDPQSWGWRIRKAGLNACSFCQQTGATHNTTISGYISGKLKPSPDIAARIEAALKALGV